MFKEYKYIFKAQQDLPDLKTKYIFLFFNVFKLKTHLILLPVDLEYLLYVVIGLKHK